MLSSVPASLPLLSGWSLARVVWARGGRESGGGGRQGAGLSEPHLVLVQVRTLQDGGLALSSSRLRPHGPHRAPRTWGRDAVEGARTANCSHRLHKMSRKVEKQELLFSKTFPIVDTPLIINTTLRTGDSLITDCCKLAVMKHRTVWLKW